MLSNNELQVINELIHYMGIWAATQGNRDADVLSFIIALIEFLHMRIPTDFWGTEHRGH